MNSFSCALYTIFDSNSSCMKKQKKISGTHKKRALFQRYRKSCWLRWQACTVLCLAWLLISCFQGVNIPRNLLQVLATSNPFTPLRQPNALLQHWRGTCCDESTRYRSRHYPIVQPSYDGQGSLDAACRGARNDGSTFSQSTHPCWSLHNGCQWHLTISAWQLSRIATLCRKIRQGSWKRCHEDCTAGLCRRIALCWTYTLMQYKHFQNCMGKTFAEQNTPLKVTEDPCREFKIRIIIRRDWCKRER